MMMSEETDMVKAMELGSREPPTNALEHKLLRINSL
jgi:hypothetical protein